MRSTQLALLLAIYAIPAVVLFSAAIAVARVKRLPLLRIEWAAWLLPGIVYALAPALLQRLDVPPAPKGLFNLVDPAVVAILCSLAFAGRVAWAMKRPQANGPAAYATIGLNMAIAVVVLLFMPPLPQ